MEKTNVKKEEPRIERKDEKKRGRPVAEGKPCKIEVEGDWLVVRLPRKEAARALLGNLL